MTVEVVTGGAQAFPVRMPVFGQPLSNPNKAALTSFTSDPTTKPRLERSLRPSSPSGFSSNSGGYVPNDPLLTCHWFAVINNMLDTGEFIQSITTPSIRYDQQSRFENGKMRHYAGFMTVDDLQMTIYTDVSGVAINTAARWIRSIRDTEGVYTLPSQYKKTVILYLLDVNDRIITEISYKGCWITSWGSYSLDYNGANIIATDLTLSVDDFAIREMDSGNTANGPQQDADLNFELVQVPTL